MISKTGLFFSLFNRLFPYLRKISNKFFKLIQTAIRQKKRLHLSLKTISATKKASIALLWLAFVLLETNSINRVWPANLFSFIRSVQPPSSARHQDSSAGNNKVKASLIHFDECDILSPEPNELPQKIVINKIGLELKIIPAQLENGSWPVQDYVANYAVETSLPNSLSGNTGLFAHDRIHAFQPIKTLLINDTIKLITENHTFLYEITEILPNIKPAQVEVFYPTTEPSLTLVTCSGVFSEQRYVIKSQFVKMIKNSCIN